MHINNHCKETLKKLGKEFRYVHEWIDGMVLMHGPMHRRIRHHKEGIEEIRELFGNEAAEAAELHVLADCGHIPSKKDYDTGAVNSRGIDFPEFAVT